MSEDALQTLTVDALIGWALPHLGHAIGQVSTVIDRADLAFASVVGALAFALNARIALLAPLVMTGMEIARLNDIEVNPALVEAIPFLALLFLILGIVQSVITAIAGRDAAATLIGIVVGGLVLFAIWRGPLRVFRLLTRGRL